MREIISNEAERLGIKLKVFTKSEIGIASKVKNVDAVVIFTNKASHKAKREVIDTAKENNIPFLCITHAAYAL